MEETLESAAVPVIETKKIVNPRVEIDTSQPFESVKEAVDRFGGSGSWIPNHLLIFAADRHDSEDFDVHIIGEQAAQLEKDLVIKEQETLDVLKQLEAAKRSVQGLKLNFMPELFSSFFVSPDLNFANDMINYSNENPSPSPQRSTGSMFLELDRAKLNLNKTSIDLALIQESVESLNKKMRKYKSLLGTTVKIQVPDSEGVLFSRNTLENYTHTAMEPKRVDFETEQFKIKMTEASRCEVMKAMAEIESTKNRIRMAEMRLNAAKKMEEAAKAIEAIAIYEKSTENSSDVLDHSNGITLSCEEYRLLTQKAQQVDQEICKAKFIDSNTTQRKNGGHQSGVAVSEKFEETKQENKQSRALDLGNREEGSVEENRNSKFKFRNSRNSGHRKTQVRHENGSNGTTSMGDILGRRVLLQDKIIVGNSVETRIRREHAPLSQMLREQSRLILHPGETTGDGNVENSYVVKRKKFGFIQVPLSMKKTKKRTQPA